MYFISDMKCMTDVCTFTEHLYAVTVCYIINFDKVYLLLHGV